jgi:hypothetical protein
LIVVGKLVCVIYENSWSGQVDNRNQGKPNPEVMPSEGVGGGGIAPPRGREGSLPVSETEMDPLDPFTWCCEDLLLKYV